MCRPATRNNTMLLSMVVRGLSKHFRNLTEVLEVSQNDLGQFQKHFLYK